ncbi:MAG: ABC-2 type transport system permease protein [Halobacteriales archaeon]|jgi:ABC-2 type transport system permease protein
MVPGTTPEGWERMADAHEAPAGVGTATERGRRLRAGVKSHVRAFVRTPINVVLLVALPIVMVEGYGMAMGAFPSLPFLNPEQMVEMGRVNGAIYTVSFFAGVLGLFQVISALQADERLRICGYSRAELFLTRLVTVVLGTLVITLVSLAVLWYSTPVEAPVAAFGGLALAGLLYGLIGMLVGAVLPRALEGSLVIVFVVDADDFLSSGMLDLDALILNAFPLHFPHQLFRDAVFDGSVASGDAAGGVAYLLVALAVVAVLYVSLTGDGGVAA